MQDSIFIKPKKLFKYIWDRGFLHLLSSNYFAQFLGFVSSLFVAKLLPPIELGEVKILQSYTSIFLILAGFGFNTAVLKLCSENRSDHEKEGILRYALSRTALTSTLTLVIIIGLALSGIVTSSKRLSLWLIIFSISIPPSALTNILLVFNQALKKIRKMASLQAVIKVQTVILVIACTWIWGFNGFVIASIVGSFLGILPALKVTGFGFVSSKLERVPQKLLQYATFSVLANGVNQLGQQGDFLILDHFSDNREAIGFYSLATIFLFAASQVTGTVQSIATPYFSQWSNNRVAFRKLLIQNQSRMFLLSLVVAAGIYLLARISIPLIYGSEYDSALTYLPILLVKYVLWSSYAIVGVALVGLGLMHYTFTIAAISTPIGLSLSFFLLQALGLVGVAWAQVGTAVLILVLSYIAMRIALGRELQEDS